MTALRQITVPISNNLFDNIYYYYAVISKSHIVFKEYLCAFMVYKKM